VQRATPGGDDVMQFGSSALLDVQPLITPQNVAGLRPLFRLALPDTVDGAPVHVSNVAMPDGSFRDLLIMTTMSGRLVAVDARTGGIRWVHDGPPGPRWTTASPAVDPDRTHIYSYGLDGRIHRYLVASGAEDPGQGWPQIVTLKGEVEKGSSALSTAETVGGRHYLYATTAGYPDPGDAGDYQGHVTAIDLDTGAQTVFNAACSDKAFHFVENGDDRNDCRNVQSGIWARSGVVYDPDTDRIFFTTGNGVYDGVRNWADSIVALRPDGSSDGGTPVDSYTPSNYQQITDEDLDLSSTTVAILPAPAGNPDWHLAIQSGKDENIRLVDLTDLSGHGLPGVTGGELQIIAVPQGKAVLSRPATWSDPKGGSWVFVANENGISALQLQATKAGEPYLKRRWQNDIPGTSPIIVNDVLLLAANHRITALDPLHGHVLWSDTSIGPVHWQSPTVANGILYMPDNSGFLNAWSLR
jgi:PQQ enzyme repeat